MKMYVKIGSMTETASRRRNAGSAPDIAGQGIANPIGQIWCGAMMLEHLGHAEAGAAVLAAIEQVLAAGPGHAPLTRDIGGTASTADLGQAIAEAL